MSGLADDPDQMPANPTEDPEKVAYILLRDSSFDEADGLKAQAYATLALVREVRLLRMDAARRARTRGN